MSIQEINGKGPKKRKKSLERHSDDLEKDRSNLNIKDFHENDDKRNETKERDTGTSCGVELLHWRDMPQHLQFNPYVLTGYRPLQGWTDCIRSLFYFHNETINILTHGNFISYVSKDPLVIETKRRKLGGACLSYLLRAGKTLARNFRPLVSYVSKRV